MLVFSCRVIVEMTGTGYASIGARGSSGREQDPCVLTVAVSQRDFFNDGFVRNFAREWAGKAPQNVVRRSVCGRNY
jgi:hypothetical protein